MMVHIITFVAIFAALIFVLLDFIKLKKLDEGNDDMKQIASIIKQGADQFMKTEYKKSLLQL